MSEWDLVSPISRRRSGSQPMRATEISAAAPKFPDASHALHGFRYQLLQTLGAWLNLRPNEELWIEVSEDYAVCSAHQYNAVQVKGSRAASGPTPYSLQSSDVRAALRRFWTRAESSSRERLTFLANGGVAVERDHPFPRGGGGLDYWTAAARGADTAPLRAALLALFDGEPLGVWLAQQPSDDELRARLLRRVTWALCAASTDDLSAQLLDQIGAVYIERGLPVTAASAGWHALCDQVFEVACRSDPATRRLTSVDLHRAIEDTLAALNIAKRMGAAAGDAAAYVQSVLVGELAEVLPATTARAQTIAAIQSTVGAEPLVWLHGGHGVGKSTLAHLLARRYGGRWLTLDLRLAQADRGGALAAWRELMRAITSKGMPDGIVLDDFAAAAVVALGGRLAALTQQMASRGGRVVVTSPQPASPARLAALGATPNANVSAPYFTDTDIQDLISRTPSPESAQIEAWRLFIRMATGGGHPLLVATKVASLRARGWPASGLAEDIGKTSEAIQITRDEARRALLRELAALDQALSLDVGALLRRIGVVFDRVDTGLVSVLAKLPPAIARASDALAVLRGSWLEALPDGDLRLSPVISDISTDVAAEDIQRWCRAAAEYWLRKRVLNERTLPLCFWNAFIGHHDWVLMKLCETLQSLDHEILRGAVALLSPMTALRTDVSLYEHNPIVGVNLRLLQFQVAAAVESDGSGADIAKRLLVELSQIEDRDVYALMTAVSASKVLMTQTVHLAPEDIVECALRLRQVTPRVQELGGPTLKLPHCDIARQFGEDVDPSDFLFASSLSKSQDSAGFLRTIEALDAIGADERRRFLAASGAIFDGLSLFVNSGWSCDQLEDREMVAALRCYECAATIAERWEVVDLNVELAVAQSVILDEALKDMDRALAIVEAAVARFGPLPALVRQKAKVLGHNDRDAEAADLMMSIEDTVGGNSKLERGLSLRDGGTSAARSGRFDIAARLFAKAIQAIDESGGHAALAAGLRVDLAMALWDSKDRAAALLRLADALDIVGTLDASASRQHERAHQFARAACGLFLSDVGSFPLNSRPNIAYGGASVLSLSREELVNVELKPLADNWRILALVEAECDLDVGIDARSRAAQTGPALASIESMIAFARYGGGLMSDDLEAALGLGIPATSAARMRRLAIDKNDEPVRVDFDNVTATPLADLLADPVWRDAVMRLPVDILVARRLQGKWSPDLPDRLRAACGKVFGNEAGMDAVLKAATGRYAIGPTEPLNHSIAAAASRTDEELAIDPSIRFNRDMLFVGHLSQSIARHALETLIVPVLQRGWADVLANQRFRLRAPTRCCPVIEDAIAAVPKHGLPAAARLVLAAATAVGESLPESWETMLVALARGSI